MREARHEPFSELLALLRQYRAGKGAPQPYRSGRLLGNGGDRPTVRLEESEDPIGRFAGLRGGAHDGAVAHPSSAGGKLWPPRNSLGVGADRQSHIWWRTNGGEFAGVEFVATPEEPSDQGWDGIGWASRIFSRYYAAQTIDGDQVIQLHGEAAPEWFAPLSNWDFKNSKLPLLLARVQAPDEKARDDPEPPV